MFYKPFHAILYADDMSAHDNPLSLAHGRAGKSSKEAAFSSRLVGLARKGDPMLIPLVSGSREFLETRDGKQKTLLLITSERGYIRLADSLLCLGADPKALDKGLSSALIYSSFNRHTGLARLLAPVSDMLHKNLFGWNAIMGGAVNGDVPLMEFLIDNKADPKDSDAGRRTPLMKAVRYERAEAVGFLAPLSDIDAVDVDLDTALIKASRYGYLGIAMTLRSFGADPLAADIKGEDCIFKARKHGHEELARFLEISL
jgi:ankyrin repeat protein